MPVREISYKKKWVPNSAALLQSVQCELGLSRVTPIPYIPIPIYIYIYISTPFNFQEKVTFTTEQAMKAHKRGRGTALLFL
jgi:hypothetical protein